MRVRAYYMYGTTAKFKSANIFISAARDQTAKFKDRQYFRLYGIQDGVHEHVIVNDSLGSMWLTATCTSQSD